jgi:hypothetical protein
MPGYDKWHGTLPMECMAVWVIETTDHEEVESHRGDESKRRRKTERKEKRNKTKERAEKKGK